MTTRTKVAVTATELSPGVPDWTDHHVNVTEVPLGATKVAFENLIAGRRYYVKSWNEDDFGNKSPELLRVVDTAPPSKTIPFSFSANGYLDSGSPMRAYVKVPADVLAVSTCIVSLAFRPFMAPATVNTQGSGSLTSDSGGGSTTTSGGGSTSGASSSSTSGAPDTSHHHTMFVWDSDIAGGFAVRRWSPFTSGSDVDLATASTATMVSAVEDSGHGHGMAHTHSTPNHTHATPDHQHTVPTHTHGLSYGTYEETYPVSHSVTLSTYKRDATALTWTLMNTVTTLIADLVDVDLSAVITSAGDWRIEVISEAAQPNGGRLGCDLYGALEVVL